MAEFGQRPLRRRLWRLEAGGEQHQEHIADAEIITQQRRRRDRGYLAFGVAADDRIDDGIRYPFLAR